MIQYNTTIQQVIEKDVIVCGGGCAGVMAGIAAARGGADTIVLERNQALGGTSGMGLVSPFMISYDAKGERQIVKGLFDELVMRLEGKDAAVHPSKVGDGTPYACYYKGIRSRHNNVTPYLPGHLRLEMAEMLREAGAAVLTDVSVVDVIMEGNRVTGVVVFDGSGLRLYKGKVVIDCTGDALIAKKAGTVQPDPEELQPMTLFFSIYGVDDAAIDAYAKDHPEEQGQLFASYIKRAREAGHYPIPRDKIGLYKTPNPGEWALNTTRIQDLNPLVAEDRTQAYLQGLEQVFFLLEFFKTLPGLENARLKEIAPMMGVRESRQLQGVYTMTLDDVIEGKAFDDSVAMGSFMIDIHPSKGTGAGIAHSPEIANCFQIPYRIMVPETVDGLLVAGRCVSGTRGAIATIRVMPQAFALGHAAGVAAAQSVKAGQDVRAIDIKQLQDELVRQNAVIA